MGKKIYDDLTKRQLIKKMKQLIKVNIQKHPYLAFDFLTEEEMGHEMKKPYFNESLSLRRKERK